MTGSAPAGGGAAGWIVVTSGCGRSSNPSGTACLDRAASQSASNRDVNGSNGSTGPGRVGADPASVAAGSTPRDSQGDGTGARVGDPGGAPSSGRPAGGS